MIPNEDIMKEFIFSEINKKKDEYIKNKIEEYYKNRTVFQRLFTSKKQEKKNIEYLAKQYELIFYERQSDKYVEKLIEERKRIDNLVDDINNNICEWFEEQKLLLYDRKPLKVEVKIGQDKGVSKPFIIKEIKCKDFFIRYFENDGNN